MKIKEGLKNRLDAYRNPVYLLYAVLSIPLFIFAALIANSGAGPLEVYLFRFFNGFGAGLEYPFMFVSLFGTAGAIVIASLILIFKRLYAEAAKLFIGAFAAYLLAYSLKMLEVRARPFELIDNVYTREDAIGTFGFPSGHAAVATVLAITAYQYLPKVWHRPVTIAAFLVMLSRMYLGVHLPADLIGGFAIGLFCGGLVNFALGSRKFSAVDPKIVKEKFATLGIKAKSVKLAAVDARGSIPYYGKLVTGENVFIKIVGKENNVADWLFKSWRKIVYRRLEDEAPFMTAKRQLEHEAYVSYLALMGGVRTPKVLGIFEATPGRWAHAQEGIDGKSLDRVDPERLTGKVLEQIWEQVEIMHDASVVHRDLRCANVFLDDNNKPWLIDFGFSEGSMPEEAKNRDRAELIASLTTLVGAERSVNVAIKVLGRETMLATAPYLTNGVLSSATSKTIKQSEIGLPQIRALIAKKLSADHVKAYSIKRFSFKRIFAVLAIGIGVYVLLPQVESFRTSFDALQHAKLWLVGAAAIFSAATYLFATWSYAALFYIPISFKKVLVIQIASSFANKVAPASTGGLALNAKFLTKSGHTITQATSIAAINNVMGFVAQFSLLIIAVLFGAGSLRDAFNIKLPFSGLLIIAVLVGLTIVSGSFLVLFKKIRRKVLKITKELALDIADFRNQPAKLFGCYVYSVLTALAFTGALYASAYALGASLSPVQLLVVSTVGIAAASITPTPGGIGGAEAALIAALTATGMDAGQAFSITLLYRLVTYWLPIIPGFLGFQYAIKEEYI